MTGEEPYEETRLIYKYKALDEVGFNARDLKSELDGKLKNIYQDLEKVISLKESVANFE